MSNTEPRPRLLKGVWELGPPTATFRLRPPGGKPIHHEGCDSRTGAPVGIVLIRPPWNQYPRVRQTFLYGVELLRRLDHPHVVKILDVLDEEGVLGAVTEPLLGDNISRQVRYRAPAFTEAEVVRILREVTAGLEHAHAQGIVFGNIKPTNIELTPQGTAKILAIPKPPYEFISFLDAAAYLGYAVYNAPEVLRSEPLDARTDVYGLGITAYEMIVATVRRQMTGNLAVDLSALVEQEWPAPADLVEEIHPLLNKIVVRCLRRDPSERYASAAEVLKDLKRVQGRPLCLISQARLLEVVGTAFPSPLAALAKTLERDDHLLAQKDKLLNLANGLLSYLGFLAARGLGVPLPAELARPALGHWVGLLRRALRAEGGGWPLAEFKGLIPDITEFLKPLDEVVQLRNEVAHATAPEEGAFLHDWVRRMSAAIKRVYKGLLFLPSYSLVAVEDMVYQDEQFLHTLRRLEGAGADAPAVQVALPAPYTRGRVYFAAGDFSKLVPLHPWVVLAKCPLCFQRELFFYVSCDGREVRYVTPDRGHSWSCPAPREFAFARGDA